MVGIVAAMSRELRSLLPYVSPEHVLWDLSGVGQDRAYAASMKMLANGAQALLNWGVAGALHERLAPGDVIIPDAVETMEGTAYSPDADWCARLRERLRTDVQVHRGSISSQKDFAASAENKRYLHERTGSVAVDMESAGIARAAREYNVPFVVVRVVSDDASTDIPTRVFAAVDEFGNVKWDALVSRVLRSPGAIPELIRVGLQFRAADASMHRIAEGVVSTCRDTPSTIDASAASRGALGL